MWHHHPLRYNSWMKSTSEALLLQSARVLAHLSGPNDCIHLWLSVSYCFIFYGTNFIHLCHLRYLDTVASRISKFYLINQNLQINELIYKIETDSQRKPRGLYGYQRRKQRWGINQGFGDNIYTLPKGLYGYQRRKQRWGINQEFGDNRYTLLYCKTDNQQGPTVQNKELYSIFCNNLYEKRI